MIIACPACATRYVVPDTAIGVDGRTVRCAKCRNNWFQDGAAPIQAGVSPPAPIASSQPPVAAAPAPQPPAVPKAVPFVAPPATIAREADPRVEEQIAQPAAAAFAEPASMVDDPPPIAENLPAPPPVYADPPRGEDYYDHGYSSFTHEPPFRPRRNPATMWTLAAALFAVVAIGAIAATARWGLPDWVPLARPTFAEAQPGLVLEFPPDRQDRRPLPDGSQFFGANGTVTNVGRTSRSVPTILVVLRDAHNAIVYRAEIVPPQRVLGPGEGETINEAIADIPKTAKFAEFGWKPA